MCIRDSFSNSLRRGVADSERHEGEIIENALEEGKMHFQRVFLSVDMVTKNNLRQFGQLGDGGGIKADITERCGEGVGVGQGQTIDCHAMRWTEQNLSLIHI